LVLIQIPYDNLQFLREEETFKARYEIMVVVTDTIGMVVSDHYSTHEASEKNYYLTNSRNLFSHFRVSLPLPEGNYQMMVEVTDLESRQHFRITESVSVKIKSPECRLSSLVLAKPGEDFDNPRDFIPLAGPALNKGESDVFLYFEASHTGEAPLEISWVLIRLPMDSVSTGRDTIHQTFVQNRIPLEIESLAPGEYEIILTAKVGDFINTGNKLFHIRYENLPQSITNIDEAIEQLRYIANEEEMESMRRAFFTAKENLFRKFWEKRDPTPGTPLNEQMEEYYRRVEYTNLYFTTQRPGWMTDRGFVYIKYGEPSEIIRNLIPRNQKPYEIWIYHQLNMEFVFEDRTGFGDYELVGPITAW
jgi:GWxTD domain-containing protein